MSNINVSSIECVLYIMRSLNKDLLQIMVDICSLDSDCRPYRMCSLECVVKTCCKLWSIFALLTAASISACVRRSVSVRSYIKCVLYRIFPLQNVFACVRRSVLVRSCIMYMHLYVSYECVCVCVCVCMSITDTHQGPGRVLREFPRTNAKKKNSVP